MMLSNAVAAQIFRWTVLAALVGSAAAAEIAAAAARAARPGSPPVSPLGRAPRLG